MTYKYRCPECRTRRKDHGLFTQHLRETGHRLCDCGGGGNYHYAHRPGSPFCVSNPMRDVLLAQQFGAGITDEELQEIEVDCAWHKPGRPFNKWRD